MITTILRKNIIEPLWAFNLKTPFLKYWRQVEKTQFLSEEALKEIQWKRFRNMLNFIFAHNKFYIKLYREHGIALSDIKYPDDIKKLPIITKNDIRHNLKELISNRFNTNELKEFRTGGSTGKALTLYATEECSELRNAVARRHDRWSGWEVGEPKAAVWGNPKYPNSFKAKLKAVLLNPVIYLDTMALTEESVVHFAQRWQKIKPTLLFGHAHSIYILAKYVNDMGLSSIKRRAIISTSMMLMPNERKLIETVFGIKVTDRYGCEEVSLIASECEKHKGMHLNIEHLFIEFVNDQGEYVRNGIPGNIIVSDLLNKAMPLIKYNVEDLGIPSDKKCSCSRGLPLMDKVVGRTADFLINQNGTKVAGISLIENTLTKIPGIEQMQVVQDSIDQFRINLVTDEFFTQESENELKHYFFKVFGEKINLKLSRLDNLEQDNNGKYRFSICRIKT